MTESVAVVRYTKAMSKPVQSAEDFGTLLEANRQELAGLIPEWSGLAWAHLVATAKGVAAENPYVYQCSADSVLQSVKTACEFGLSFAKAGGQAYLVPFKNQCTLIIGYRGLMDLARRSADVTSLQSGVVYKGDTYEPHLGSNPHIVHTPNPTASHADDKIVAAYSIAKHRSGEQSVETMTVEDIKKIRSRSKAAAKGPWVSDFAEMCRKTVERRHLKRLSWRAEDKAFMERVVAHDNATAGIEAAPTASPEDRLRRMHSLLNGESDIVEGEVVAAESPPPAPPTDTEGHVLADHRAAIMKLCERGAKKWAASTATILARVTKKVLGDSLGLDEMNPDQALAVREALELELG